jgi:5-methyltetrahydropteroyltriglutamate--homocysteine methyltransferase
MTTPFRADNLGSMLRPPELIEVRTAHQDGRIDAAGLREIENRCILKALELQKSD